MCGDEQLAAMRLLYGCPRGAGVVHRKTSIERELHEPRSQRRDPRDRLPGLVLARDLEAVAAGAPGLGRIAARSGEERAREGDLERSASDERRHEPFRGAEIEDGGDATA